MESVKAIVLRTEGDMLPNDGVTTENDADVSELLCSNKEMLECSEDKLSSDVEFEFKYSLDMLTCELRT